jgi:hypothetical protein
MMIIASDFCREHAGCHEIFHMAEFISESLDFTSDSVANTMEDKLPTFNNSQRRKRTCQYP